MVLTRRATFRSMKRSLAIAILRGDCAGVDRSQRGCQYRCAIDLGTEVLPRALNV